MNVRDFNRRLRIERPVASSEWDGAGGGHWAEVATVWAQVQDMLPSRGERIADGINVSARPARIRMRFRRDVTPNMRFVVEERTLQIVSGPAELGRREALEFVAEEYRSAGNAA